jgi:hypothetical protein
VHHRKNLKRVVFYVVEDTVRKPSQPSPPRTAPYARRRLGISREPDQRCRKVLEKAEAQVGVSRFVEAEGLLDILGGQRMKDDPI